MPTQSSTSPTFPPLIESASASIARALPDAVPESVWHAPTPSRPASHVRSAFLASRFRRARAMRSDRRENIRAILLYMIRHFDIASGALLVKRARWFRPLTVDDLAKGVGVHRVTVNRVLRILERLGYLEPEEQRIFPGPRGDWLFSPVLRRLTDTFFRDIGLSLALRLEREKRLKSGKMRFLISRPLSSKPRKQASTAEPEARPFPPSLLPKKPEPRPSPPEQPTGHPLPRDVAARLAGRPADTSCQDRLAELRRHLGF